MSGNDSTEPTPTPEPSGSGPRLFYTRNSAEDFFRQFNEILDRRDQAQEASTRMLNETIVKLTASVDRLAELVQGMSPRSSPAEELKSESSNSRSPSVTGETLGSSMAPTPNASSPEPIPRLSVPLPDGRRELSTSPEERLPEFRPTTTRPTPTRRRSPVQSGSLPIRELSAPPSLGTPQNGETALGRIPHLKPPKFKGRDGENVLFWLHQMEVFFVLFRVADEYKTYNASQCIGGEAGNFYIYLITANDGQAPTWNQLRHAFLSRYHNPSAREEILRHKLNMVEFKAPHRMSEYCEKFRELEAQIYDMAFIDRLNAFLYKLPREAALHIRNSVGDAKEMEVAYRLARQWATNVRSTVNIPYRTGNSYAPPLLRFGKVKPKPSRPAKADKKREREEESDTEDELDVLHLKKADMDQVTCFRCGKNGHFARDCKGKRSASASPGHSTRQKPRFTKKDDTIFYTTEDAARYGLDESRNERYDYDYDNHTYSPSQSSASDSSESDNEQQNGIMYLEPTTSYEHLKA